MVDVVRHRVVVEHRGVFLLEVGPDCLDQHWTWEKREEIKKTKQEHLFLNISMIAASTPDHWQQHWQLLLTSTMDLIFCSTQISSEICTKTVPFLKKTKKQTNRDWVFRNSFKSRWQKERIADGGRKKNQNNFQHLFQSSENNQSDDDAKPGGQVATSFLC